MSTTGLNMPRYHHKITLGKLQLKFCKKVPYDKKKEDTNAVSNYITKGINAISSSWESWCQTTPECFRTVEGVRFCQYCLLVVVDKMQENIQIYIFMSVSHTSKQRFKDRSPAVPGRIHCCNDVNKGCFHIWPNDDEFKYNSLPLCPSPMMFMGWSCQLSNISKAIDSLWHSPQKSVWRRPCNCRQRRANWF